MDTLCPVHGNALYRKAAIILATVIAVAFICYKLFFAPVHIAVTNATLSQQADIALNNDGKRGRKVGIAYELENGEIIYVPEQAGIPSLWQRAATPCHIWNKQQLPQNTIQVTTVLVCCVSYSVGRCSNFVAPSKWKAVLRSAEYLLLEGDLQDGELPEGEPLESRHCQNNLLLESKLQQLSGV